VRRAGNQTLATWRSTVATRALYNGASIGASDAGNAHKRDGGLAAALTSAAASGVERRDVAAPRQNQRRHHS
jgi:hypothetical protein